MPEEDAVIHTWDAGDLAFEKRIGLCDDGLGTESLLFALQETQFERKFCRSEEGPERV